MAVLSKEFGFVFLATPRTASKAVARALVLNGLGSGLGRHHARPEELTEAASLPSLRWYAGVRNPFDWIASQYVKHLGWARQPETRPKWTRGNPGIELLCQPSTSFDQWVEVQYGSAPLKKSQLTWVRGCHDIYRFEKLPEDFHRLLIQAGVPPARLPELPVWNTTPHKRHYSTYYTADSRKLVELCCAEDLQAFGYTFETCDSGARSS